MEVLERKSVALDEIPRQYLTFKLDREEYGIDILKVQEIRGYEAPTRLSHAPDFIKGVVNLRGTIVPIVDMRLRFGCAAASYTSFTVVIVLHLKQRVVGVVVDSVSDVVQLKPAQIRAAPDVDSALGHDAVLGLGALEDRMLILMDIERLMAGVDMGLAVAN